VVCRHLDRTRLHARAAAERVTGTVGVAVEGLPRLGQARVP